MTPEQNPAARLRVIHPGDQFRLRVDALPGLWITVKEAEGDVVQAENEHGGQSTWSAASLATGYGGSVTIEWRK